MTKLLALFFTIVSLLTLTHAANAQIISIEGSHNTSCNASHQDLGPPPQVVTNSSAQIVPVTILGPSSTQCFAEDNLFDASVMMDGNWIADSESVVGSVTTDGHINYPGWIGVNIRPGFDSEVLADFIVNLEAANTPFRITIDWDMLPFSATGDGSGHSVFFVTLGDRLGFSHYQIIAGSSTNNVIPNSGATGNFVLEGVSRMDNLRVNVRLNGYGSTTGGTSCGGLVCNFGSMAQQSFLNYELLVGDAALAADTDTDGVVDSADNCTLIANPDQRDTNGDGYGNICDPDLNNDGVVNFADVSLWIPFFNTNTNGDEDFNGDEFVNFGDYVIFPGFFLQPPGPSAIAP